MLSGEFECVIEAKRHHRLPSSHPLVRGLTGAEEVHLASGRARWPKLARGATGKEHGEPWLRWLTCLDAMG